MEKKKISFTIDTEEELKEKYQKIYNQLKADEYTIPMAESSGLLQKLNLIEKKAKHFGVISPNEYIEGKQMRNLNKRN
jgi:hypothetical protein